MKDVERAVLGGAQPEPISGGGIIDSDAVGRERERRDHVEAEVDGGEVAVGLGELVGQEGRRQRRAVVG
jgi:hypothetical protein